MTGRYLSDIGDLLYERSNDKNLPLSQGFIEAGIELAQLLLTQARDEEDEESEGDWLQLAINRPSGKVAMFALRSLDSLWSQQGKANNWTIPEALRSLFDDLATNHPLGRVVLSGNLHFLLGVDEAWATQKLLPFFSWSEHAEEAGQVWSGFLDWGHPNGLVRESLMPYLRDTFRANSLSERSRERLAEYTAWFSFSDDKNPVAWLRDFLKGSRDEERAHFAHQYASILGDLSPEQREELWRNWLSSYFQERLVGPPSLEKKEKLALIRWCEEFPERLSEMAKALAELPPPELEFHQLHRLLDGENSLPASDGLAELLLWVLKGQKKGQFHGYYCEQLRGCLQRLRGTLDRQLYRKLVERYSDLGCPDPSSML